MPGARRANCFSDLHSGPTHHPHTRKAGQFAAEGVHSALVADGHVARFLADAEPPAHDTWTTTKLHRFLASGHEEDLPDELLDFFWFEDPTSHGAARGRSSGRTRPGRTPAKPKDLPPRRPLMFRIDQTSGGFTVRAGPGLTDDLLPCRARVRMASDLEDGDALKSWSSHDFDLSDDDIEIETQGGTVVESHRNEIQVDVGESDFRLRLHGFDPNRDLEVRAVRLKDLRS